jgi:hypothetical protein
LQAVFEAFRKYHESLQTYLLLNFLQALRANFIFSPASITGVHLYGKQKPLKPADLRGFWV